MRCVDWNQVGNDMYLDWLVTPRMRCVDWNNYNYDNIEVWRWSHLVWGVWIEIMTSSSTTKRVRWSHLVWGVWIEMYTKRPAIGKAYSHTSYEVCGLKLIVNGIRLLMSPSHTSYEVCGLKFRFHLTTSLESLVTPRMRCVDWNLSWLIALVTLSWSHLVWGVWIEISLTLCQYSTYSESHLVWGVWIEIWRKLPENMKDVSHTSYEVCGLKWLCSEGGWLCMLVTPRMRCVDWNITVIVPSYPLTQSHLVWGVWIEILNAVPIT